MRVLRLDLSVGSGAFASLLYHILGGYRPPEKELDEMRWEDDGGPVRIEYDHILLGEVKGGTL